MSASLVREVGTGLDRHDLRRENTDGALGAARRTGSLARRVQSGSSERCHLRRILEKEQVQVDEGVGP